MLAHTQATAQDATHGRVDLIAESTGISLENGMWLAASDSFIERRNWLPIAEQRASYFAEFAVDYFAAAPSVLMFTATGDARVRVELAAPWKDSGNGEPLDLSVTYESFQADGADVVEVIPQLTTASIRKPIAITLAVKKNVPVRLEIAARSNIPKGVVAATTRSGRAYELAQKLKRGVNLSNWLEVPPSEDWGDNSCNASDMRQIAREGFDHIRLPVGWHHYVGKAPNFMIDPKILSTVDQVIRQATDAGLAVIVNIHHFEEFTTNPQAEVAKLVAIWKQLSQRYAAQPDSVFFEILNEPKEAATTVVMNAVYPKVLSTIRATNPNRGVLVGPGNFNSISELSQLRLPADDQNLIVTVHSYDPFVFTHQRAEWTDPAVRNLSQIKFPGPPLAPVSIPSNAADWVASWLRNYNSVASSEYNPSSSLPIRRALAVASGWSEFHGRPVHLGEFGAYTTADSTSRANYYAEVRKRAEPANIGWCIWDWKAGFAYWDRSKNQPLAGMRDALFPAR